ncbi:MAG: ATP-binding protein [Verrucomicrobiota bacterium]
MSTHATINSSPLQPGFRLQRLEVRNWGTFDGKIHILDPLGKTALLLGENGSGKSTLVDAFLTLLVPRTKRNYNMSAGSAKKRERDERTYVLGAYGSESSSEESRAQIKFLRKKPGAPPTILLACFLNDATGESVSLAQILWVQDEDVRKLFLIARSVRSIKGDFDGLQESRSWKKALKQRGFEVEESFPDYAEKVVRYLKMESTTTLALFSQTVAIKEITHVSTFIRDHMLERLDTRELMERLEQHYEDLTKCWDAIQRARRQLELLQPVADKAAEIQTHQTELEAAVRFNDALPACFAIRLKALLETEMSVLADSIASLEKDITTWTEQLEGMEKDKFSIQQAIDNDEVGKQLAKVQEELETANSQENTRRALSSQYHASLKELGLVKEVADEARFVELYAWAQTEGEAQTEIINTSATEMAVAGEQLRQLKIKADEVDYELTSLRNRPDLIPEGERQLREAIARGAGVEVTDLPFAGELMDVREEHSAQWRGALERLLRGFGLSILVPEQIYSRVSVDQLQRIVAKLENACAYVVLRNQVHSEEFAVYDQSVVRNRLSKELGAKEITVAKMQPWLVEDLSLNNLTVTTAVQDGHLHLLDRQRLQTWQRRLYAEIESASELLLPVKS